MLSSERLLPLLAPFDHDGGGAKVDTLRPNPDGPTYIRPEDFLNGRVEQGFHGKPVDGIIILNAAWIAGGGPATQLSEVVKEFSVVAAHKNIPIGYIGPEFEPELLAERNVTVLEGIGEAPTVKEKYEESVEALYSALSSIDSTNGETILGILSIGYTAYGPRAVKEAIARVHDEKGTNIRAVFVNFDSAYPDTDSPSNEIDADGVPIDRFNPDSYKSTDDVIVYHSLLNPLPVDPELKSNRAPNGALCLAASMPFSQETVVSLENLRDITTSEARARLVAVLKESVPTVTLDALTDPRTIFVPLIVSGDYFDSTSIGKWMTSEQFQDVGDGVSLVLEALQQLSHETGRPVLTMGVEEFVDFAKNNPREGVSIEGQDSEDSGVLVAKRPVLSRQDHAIYMKAADVCLHRTTQANAFTESSLAGAPSYVITMPSKGYMDAEFMDNYLYTHVGNQSTTDIPPSELAQNLRDIVEDPEYRDGLVDAQSRVLGLVFTDSGRNFYTVMNHIMGIK